MVSTPLSVMRAISTLEFAASTLTDPAKVSCAQPRRSASMAGTTLIRASVDSVPQKTKSKPPLEITSANTFDVAIASEPARAASATRTPLSAPMDKPLRIASVARSGPIEIKVIVCSGVSLPSLRGSTTRSASSIAYSSRSLRTASTPLRSRTPLTIFFSAQESGTCFTQIAIFILSMLLGSNLVLQLKAFLASISFDT